MGGDHHVSILSKQPCKPFGRISRPSGPCRSRSRGSAGQQLDYSGPDDAGRARRLVGTRRPWPENTFHQDTSLSNIPAPLSQDNPNQLALTVERAKAQFLQALKVGADDHKVRRQAETVEAVAQYQLIGGIGRRSLQSTQKRQQAVLFKNFVKWVSISNSHVHRLFYNYRDHRI